jgi:hypothetical protein
MSGKALQYHQIYDPTRLNSRLFKFTLPDGESAFMEIFTIPKAGLGESAPRKPTRSQTIQTITAAATTNINNYLK